MGAEGDGVLTPEMVLGLADAVRDQPALTPQYSLVPGVEGLEAMDEAVEDIQRIYRERREDRMSERDEMTGQWGIRRLVLSQMMVMQCADVLGLEMRHHSPVSAGVSEDLRGWVQRERGRLGLPEDVRCLEVVDDPTRMVSKTLVLLSRSWLGIGEMQIVVETPEAGEASIRCEVTSGACGEIAEQPSAPEPSAGVGRMALAELEKLEAWLEQQVPQPSGVGDPDVSGVDIAIGLLGQKQIPAQGLVLTVRDSGVKVGHPSDQRERLRWGSQVFWNGEEIRTLKRVTLDADGVPELVFGQWFKDTATDRQALEELRSMGCRVLIEPDRESGPAFGEES
jgi:hypothetical protein